MRCHPYLLISSVMLAVACGESSNGKPRAPTTSALKSDDATGLEQQDEPDDEAEDTARKPPAEKFELDPNAAFLDAKFDVLVNAVGSDVCGGSADIKLNANVGGDGPNAAQLLSVPYGVIDCTVYKIDLAQLLGSLTQSSGGAAPIEVKDGVIALPTMGTGLYTPPRPMLPSFLAEDRDTLRNLDHFVNLQVYDQNAQKTDVGSVRLRVTSLGEPYRVEALQRTFDDTIQFEITVEGLDAVDRVDNFIFERMGFVMSLDPIALLHIEFDGPASDLADGADRIGIDLPQDGLMGAVVEGIGKMIDVHIALDLRWMQGLDADREVKGPIVGGREL